MIRLSVTGVVLFGLAACLAGSRIGEFEATDGATVEKAPLRTFTTPRRCCRQVLNVFVRATPLLRSTSGGEALVQ
jgi:hypothetical protein